MAKNDGKQGTPYGTSFGRGSNVTAIRHNDSCLEFAVNGHSQGIRDANTRTARRIKSYATQARSSNALPDARSELLPPPANTTDAARNGVPCYYCTTSAELLLVTCFMALTRS